MIPIKQYLDEIYEDFSDYVDDNNGLCHLQDLSYNYGNIPDYNDINLQQLYLLRYTFSYAFEYKYMFQSFFKKEEIGDKIRMTSFGCGNMIDYWAAAECLEDIDSDCKIIYEGLDLIDWNYKIKKRRNDIVSFKQEDISDWFNEIYELDSDIYIFPKSISEFSSDEFAKICEGFENLKIKKNKIHIFISARAEDENLNADIKRSVKLSRAIKNNGFASLSKENVYNYFPEKCGIKKIFYDFDYPDGAKELLNNLYDKCNAYTEGNEMCDISCFDYLNRSPILTVGYVRYQILTFQREDKQ